MPDSPVEQMLKNLWRNAKEEKFVNGKTNIIPEFKLPETTFSRENGRVARAELLIYEKLMAEFSTEKTNRARKFAKTHAVRNDGKYIQKDARKAYRKEKCFSCDSWHGYNTVAEFRRLESERATIADNEVERKNRINAMREIEWHRDMLEFIQEQLRKMDEWFLDDDIGRWVYPDGELCDGALERINERAYYLRKTKEYKNAIDNLIEKEAY